MGLEDKIKSILKGIAKLGLATAIPLTFSYYSVQKLNNLPPKTITISKVSEEQNKELEKNISNLNIGMPLSKIIKTGLLFFFGSTALLMAFSSYYSRRKRKQLPLIENKASSKILDFLTSPYFSATTIASISSFIYHKNCAHSKYDLGPILNSFIYAENLGMFALSWGFTYSLSNIVQNYKFPKTFNFLKAVTTLFRPSSVKSLKSLISTLKYKDEYYYTKKAFLDIKKRNFDSALNKYKTVLSSKSSLSEMISFKNISYTGGYTITFPLTSALRQYKIYKTKSIFDLLDFQMTELLYERKQNVIKIYEKINILSKKFKKFKRKNELNFLEALILDSIDETDLSRQQWEKSINLILENPDLSEYMESIQGHKVYRLVFNEFLKSVITLKQDKLSSLEGEMNNLNYLETKINKELFDIAKPIKLLELNNKHYLIEKHALGKSFDSAFEKSKNYDLFRKTANFLATIHAEMPSENKSKDYYSDIWSKLKRSSLPENLKKELFENIDCFLDTFYDKPLVFDRDAHIEQWYVAENKIIAFDLVNRGSIPAEFDTSKLFNRGDFFPRNTEGDKLKDNILTKDYLHLYNYHLPKNKRRSDEDFIMSSLNATPIKALTNYLFALTRPSKLTPAVQFIDNAIHDINRIINEFSLHQDHKKYVKFSNALTKLKNHRTIAK